MILLLPGVQRCRYSGALTDAREAAEAAAGATAAQLLDLCRTVHDRTDAEVLDELAETVVAWCRSLGIGGW